MVVDAGAYTGDTAVDILRQYGNNKIYCYEMDDVYEKPNRP